MHHLPDWLSAEEFRITVEIDAEAVNGEDGWTAEFRPLPLSQQVELEDETLAEHGMRRHAPTLLDRMLVELESPTIGALTREDLGDLDQLHPPLARFLAIKALQISQAGTPDLGEGFTLRPLPGGVATSA